MFSKDTSSTQLHTVYLKSNIIILRPVTASVAPPHSFPFKGIQVILGKDAAGQGLGTARSYWY